MTATIYKPSPVVALRHYLMDTYGWPIDVARDLIAAHLPELSHDELNTSGRPNEKGCAHIKRLVRENHTPAV